MVGTPGDINSRFSVIGESLVMNMIFTGQNINETIPSTKYLMYAIIFIHHD